jgi:Peptidase M50B-like
MDLSKASLHLQWFKPVLDGFAWGLLAMMLHEVGHLLAALAVGIKVKSVALRWKGLCTVREAGPPDKNLLVSLAGPFANVLLLLLWPMSHRFGVANICFAAVNLLPINGSDGDRALTCLELIREQSSNHAEVSSECAGVPADSAHHEATTAEPASILMPRKSSLPVPSSGNRST